MPGVPAVTPAGRGFTDSVCVSISSNRIRRLAPESQTRDLTGGFGAAPEHPASPGLWRGLLAGSPSTAARAGASSGTVITHPFVLVALMGKRQRSLSLLAREMREMLTPVISA